MGRYQRLPMGLREQPAWVFIGFMFLAVGLGYATGLVESSVARTVGGWPLQVWGITLALSGLLLMVATIRGRPALERFALRAVTCALFTYCIWLLTVTTPARAGIVYILAAGFIALAEFRVYHLKTLMATSIALGRYLKDSD